jgi:hypothetical protein
MYLVNKYSQITGQIKNIIEENILAGERDQKKIIAQVLTSLQSGRTPDVKQIIKIYNEVIDKNKQLRLL